MRREELLVNRLVGYGESDMYPFHMPGHKRFPGHEDLPGHEHLPGHEDLPGRKTRLQDSPGFPDPYTIDITEIDGFDNLHHPQGVLRDSMKWAAAIYGADQTYYLVNGSTSGILSAVCGTVPRGGRILVGRNCHKSVYHGIYLSQLKASYIYLQEIDGLGIQGAVTASDVDRMLHRYMDTQAVLVVSPTYDGIVSDIESIAQVVHRAGLPLIVDEAHGAHFRYGDMFPVSALELGADVVVQSVHKTLPSLTQTALLHIKCNRPDGGCFADRDRMDRYIHMVQSSSPSYVLMASIENSIYQMEHMDTEPYRIQLETLRKRLRALRHLRLVDTGLKGQAGIYDLDRSKVVVSTRGTVLAERYTGSRNSGSEEIHREGLTGAMLDHILRSEYHLEMEMCGADYVTAITTVMDSSEGLKRLGDALLEIDSRLGDALPEEAVCGGNALPEEAVRLGNALPEPHSRPGTGLKPHAEVPQTGCGQGGNCTGSSSISVYSMPSDVAMTIGDAMDAELRTVGLKDCGGSISGEFVYIYPPGIPIVAPGEWISRRALDVILEYIETGLPVQGLADQTLETIRVVRRD